MRCTSVNDVSIVGEKAVVKQSNKGLYKILPLEQKYIEGAVDMHLMAFGEFFLAQLGRGFLTEYYRQVAGHDLTVGYVAVDDCEKVVGAGFAVLDSSKFYKDIARRRWWAFGLQSLWPLMKSPKIILRLIRGLKHRGNIPPCDIKPLGALLSLAVRPDCQGQGLGAALMRSVHDEHVRRGVDAIFLTTDADNNDRVLGFYAGIGWDLLGHFMTPEKRRMCWYLWKNPEKEKNEYSLTEKEKNEFSLIGE